MRADFSSYAISQKRGSSLNLGGWSEEFELVEDDRVDEFKKKGITMRLIFIR